MSCLPYLMGLFLIYLLLCLIYFYLTRSRYWFYGVAFAALVGPLLDELLRHDDRHRTHWGTR